MSLPPKTTPSIAPPLHINTPLVHSQPLSLASQTSIWLKLDALQPSGSFKLRGVGAACQHYARQGARRFVSSSGGNAGLAVAYAGQQLAIPVIVVVPETTTQRAKDLLQQEGAAVIVNGPSWHEANDYAQSLLTEDDAFIHPFDDPLLWAGHASIIDEVVESGLRPDAVVVSVGGGGLLCGIVEGLQRHHLHHVTAIAVETQGADSFNQAIQAGHPVELEAITSIASSLGAKRICDRAWQLYREREHPIRSVVVSDRAALEACERFLDDCRVLVEPACGASLALAYEAGSLLSEFETVLVVVCGGVTASIDQIRQWATREAT